MRQPYRLALLALLILNVVAAASAATQSPIQRSFNVTAAGKIVIKSDVGSINVRTVPGNRVTVTVNRVVATDDKEDAADLFKKFTVSMQQNGNVIEVTGKRDYLDFSRWFGSSLHVTFDVAVPANFGADLSTAGGDVQVSDLTGSVVASTAGGDLRIGNTAGSVDARTAGGDVTIKSVRGQTSARTSGGDITVTEAAGPLDIRTAGGDIRIGRAAANLTAKTSGGDIEIGSVRGVLDASTSGGSVKVKLEAQPSADSRVSTSGGGIDIALPAAAKLYLDASTSGGKVSADLVMTIETMKSSTLKGKVNGGGPALQLRSSGGDINVRKF